MSVIKDLGWPQVSPASHCCNWGAYAQEMEFGFKGQGDSQNSATVGKRKLVLINNLSEDHAGKMP